MMWLTGQQQAKSRGSIRHVPSLLGLPAAHQFIKE